MEKKRVASKTLFVMVETVLVSVFLLTVGFFIGIPVKSAEIPPPSVIIPFSLLSVTSESVQYQAKVVFTTGELPNGGIAWEETDRTGVYTGRIWVKISDSSKIWDVVPVMEFQIT